MNEIWAAPIAALIISATSLVLAALGLRSKANTARVEQLEHRVEWLTQEIEAQERRIDEMRKAANAQDTRIERLTGDLASCERQRIALLERLVLHGVLPREE